jgi:lipid-A-disaccharide synthase
VFYCPPQIWAWASWRIKKMRRLVDHVLSALPFEHDWFTAQGMRSTYVGHPFFDELEDAVPRRRDEATPLVLLLPGSRGQEIEGNLASILRAAALVKGRVPAARFAIGALHERHATRIREMLAAQQQALGGLDVAIEAACTRSLITEAACAIAVSGSVSLELLASRVPTVIMYRISGLAYVVQSWYRRVRFITLVNLLACRDPIGPVRPTLLPPAAVEAADPEAVYPEYLAVQDPAREAAAHVVAWLTDPVTREHAIGRIEAVAARVATGGSAAHAADAVLTIASGGRATVGMPLPAARAA